jgi:long-chain alkane monooxygenase
MTKEIRLNAFEMNCVAHQSPGMWRHPRDRSRDYRRLDGWIELAKTLERGFFDGLFLADVLGIYDVFGGNPESALRHATQTPVNDPLLLVPAMAAATKHLGFGVTVTLSYEPPFPFARRMSTLDHLTEGRIGWNVVTGYLDSAAKGMGEKGQRGHDDRYEVAEDYMSVVYKLWEGSWADDAVVATSRRAYLLGLIACAGSIMTARITSWTPSTFPSHRRSARLSCIRRGPRPRGAPSRPATPNACSCPDPQRR